MRCKALKPTSDSRLQDFLGTLQSFGGNQAGEYSVSCASMAPLSCFSNPGRERWRRRRGVYAVGARLLAAVAIERGPPQPGAVPIVLERDTMCRN
jgi:hypothetical protein